MTGYPFARTPQSTAPAWRPEKVWLAGLVLVALIIRLALMYYLATYRIASEQNHWPFGFETGRVAQALAEGRGFASPFQEPTGPTAWLAPVYPLLLALIFKGFGVYSMTSAVMALGLNSLLSALTCIGLYRLGKTIFGAAVGWLAAGLFAVYPPSIWHAINTVWDTTLFVLALVFLVDYLYRLPPHPSRASSAGAGLLMGFILLINPAALAFYPCALVWLWTRVTDARRKRIEQIGIILVLIGVVVLPWLIRNQRVLGRFTLKSNAGLELKRGNSLIAWQTLRTRDWEQVNPSITPEEFRRYAAMTEIPYLDHCRQEALNFIRQNPEKFIQLVLRRIAYFWLGELDEENEWTGSVHALANLSWMKRLSAWGPLPFFLLGTVLAICRRLPIGLLLWFFASFPLVYYITHVTNRYRYPVEPFLLLLTAYGVWALGRRLQLRRRWAQAFGKHAPPRTQRTPR